MNLTRRRLCAALALTGLPAAARAEPATLTLGLFPNLPAHKLIELYRPLADYLEQQLNCKVNLFSAKDFRAFYRATRKNQFDILVTAPHLAWLAMVESDYRPLATFTSPVTGVVIARRDADVRTAVDCRGRTVAMVDPLSIVSQLGLNYFKTLGLTPNVDYRLAIYNNHANAALAVMIEKADCAVVGNLPFQQMAGEVQSQLRVVAETAAVPSQFVMTNARLPPALCERVRSALLAFSRTPSGSVFIKTFHVGTIVAAEPSALEPIELYALITKAMLNRTNE
ncbi:hypothetical protein CAP31_00955 [Sulfuriferula sp. AH1]|uniref:phosphate/phosphite/phosphonate ABC transporter substrate-binding protein n=1 Tax=Sulfuriferula sp. AH1 TaxID=1985873 RepID=UPI000B3B1B15|nr:phosphate/phosphite/phosphonate ABC transporter substrate-binding protein [Sulfuriferula sp. AH1]ARU30385.1 hypothetical protein CAP31_00955 [Sulfuriferula sp. AH1]